MKRIKIAFVDFGGIEDEIRRRFTDVLKERYELEVCKNYCDAEYIFYSCFGTEHWRVPEDKILIFYTGENICPDFNICDYAIGFERMNYGDRYLRLPIAYCSTLSKELISKVERKHLLPLPQKDSFCSFVVSNPNAKHRINFFHLLSKYKSVDSGGRHLNNIGKPVKNKFDFDSRHKFSICFENASHPGYTTEKLFDALAAQTIPIYWGDTTINDVINPNCYVNIQNIGSFEAAVELIKEIDSNENKYQQMLTTPVFLHEEKDGYDAMNNLFIQFLYNIFDQDISTAYRFTRSGVESPNLYKQYLADAVNISEGRIVPVLTNRFKRKLKRLIDKIRG